MQLGYVEDLVSAFKELFEQLVRHNSGSALIHDHAGQVLDRNTKGRQGVLFAVAPSAKQAYESIEGNAAACRACNKKLNGMPTLS